MKRRKNREKLLTLKSKNILVTGGCGFIGSHLVDMITQESPGQIIVIDRDIKKKRPNLVKAFKNFPRIKLFQLNVSNYKNIVEVLKKFKVDVVFHLAALSLVESLVHPKKVVLSNVRMVVNLLELQRLGFFKTLILVSSSEAYGTAETYPMSEKHFLQPTTPYAASKAATDLIALSYNKTFKNDVAIVRPFNNYGPRQNPFFKGIVTHTIELLLANKSPVLYGKGEQTRDYIFVRDTVTGMLEVYKHKSTRGQIINLGSGRMIKIKDLVNKLIKISGKKIRPSFLGARVADVRNHCADIRVAKRLLGWEPEVSLEKGLKETYEWYKRGIKLTYPAKRV